MKMVRKFGGGVKDSKGSYAAGVRLGNAKSAKWAHRASGGRCMGDVEGDKPKMNFGRPGRASGGSVKKKADGGWVGEGDSGKRLREEGDHLRDAVVARGFTPSGINMSDSRREAMDRTARDEVSATYAAANKAEGRKFGGRTRMKKKG